MTQKTITRFAPSPTGYIHIGNVRSAIYPYLLAKQNHGDFVLRIEDTDRARYVDGATELIEDTLTWLGLDWDKGPQKPSQTHPSISYFQSERQQIYLNYAKKLLDQGRAYFDHTDQATLQSYRDDAAKKKQPFLYRNYRPDSLDTRWQNGVPLRFKSDPKLRHYHDEVFGDQDLKPETQDDIILLKADGMPTYNFAHIVDDAEMEITHLFRGQEYLPSMGNYLALYEALDLTPPKFIHLPHILGPTGNKKLSKRDGAKSVTDYRQEGILPEAMLNYLACLGWNDGTEDELYSKADLISKFKVDRIQHAGARFDEQKLLWLNGQWLRRLYAENPDQLFASSKAFWPENSQNQPEKQRQVFAIIYDRLKTFADLKTMTSYFFADPQVDLDQITNNKALKKLSEHEICSILRKAVEKLCKTSSWTPETLQNDLNHLLDETKLKPMQLFGLLRLSVSFAPFSPALHDTLAVLGRDTTIARLNAVLTAFARD
ncbi:glutamate--tRNA ligase [Candidatus Saccharibacteria bacterium]|nr:glutamate--tRNA ligase [Candidatus Saccharibacteria bacterium]